MTGQKTLTALGLMSGTSMDGIDAAVIYTDGRRIEGLGPSLTLSYDEEFRALLRAALGSREPQADLEIEITFRHVQAVKKLLAQGGLAADGIDVIGFHGHTLLHDPQNRLTRQIGQGALLARSTGIDVVDDFRSADVAAGGQGAPLAPLVHLAHLDNTAGDLERPMGRPVERPVAVLNLGGVGNVTWIGTDEGEAAESTLMGFDTGPGNALIDDWIFARTGRSMDRDGAAAAQGKVDEGRVAEYLTHPFFQKAPPKSIDRGLLDGALLDGLSTHDGAATLCALTVRAVGLAVPHFPAPVKNWLISGGGRKNPTLMKMLAEHLDGTVRPVEAVGWDGDMVEAQAFAYLAVRSLRQLPISVPGTTGVPAPLTGGVLHRAQGA